MVGTSFSASAAQLIERDSDVVSSIMEARFPNLARSIEDGRAKAGPYDGIDRGDDGRAETGPYDG